MSFDIFQSRRNANEECRWWIRNDNEEIDEDELVYKRVPRGTFCAEEVTAEVQNDNSIAGVYMADKTSVTLKSPDDLTDMYVQTQDITNKALVEYQGEIWRVEDVQKKKARIQNSEFGKVSTISHFWFLSLIKG